MEPVIEEGLSGWVALSTPRNKDEYVFSLYAPNGKSFILMSYNEVKCSIDSCQISSYDLDGYYWTRKWNGPKETDKEKCVEELCKYVEGFINCKPPTNHKGVYGILDKYWPGENECG